MKTIISLIIFIQIVIIANFVLNIFKSRFTNVSNKAQFLPIMHDNYIDEHVDGLKRFYEPKPDTNIEFSRSWLPKKAILTINKDSLNERFNYPIKKDPKTFRIITLGNSFTFGGYTNTADNWTEQLEVILNKQRCKSATKFEVINLGVGGYDLEYEVERYKLRGQKYQPNLVLWYVNSPNKINEYLLDKEKQIMIEMKLTRYDNEYYHKDGVNYPTWVKAYELLSKEIGESKMIAYQEKILSKMDDVYKGPLILFTFDKIKSQDKYSKLFIDFAHSRKNAAYFQNEPFLEDLPQLTLFDGHPNVQGHSYIANGVMNYLKSQKIISLPCALN